MRKLLVVAGTAVALALTAVPSAHAQDDRALRDVLVVSTRGATTYAMWGGNVSVGMVHRGVKGIVIDGNTYDAGAGHLIHWAGRYYDSLTSVRAELGFEQSGTQVIAAGPTEADVAA